MKLSEAVNHVIELGRKINTYYHAEARKRHKHYPLVSPGEEEAPPPLEEKELEEFLATVPDDVLLQMLLIMHIWREGFPRDSLTEYYGRLKEEFGDARDAVDELMGNTVTLADELAGGLEELAIHKMSVDKLLPKKANVRKR